MNTTDFDLFGTQDLIDELLRRATFQGVIVHAKTRPGVPTGRASASSASA